MTDQDCVQFLQWALPRMQMRWQGFRKVRRQVCKRIDRRMHLLGLENAAAYRAMLERNGAEWDVLDSLCLISISRFYRDPEVWQSFERDVLGRLCDAARLRGEVAVKCWSIGCASGEEPYTLSILWKHASGRLCPSLDISILATDSDPNMIARARQGRYRAGSLLGLPQQWKSDSFDREQGLFRTRADIAGKVLFMEQDIRKEMPDGPFDLILCRNMAFTYFDRELQIRILADLSDRLRDSGTLVLGTHESLPPDSFLFRPWPRCRAVYQKRLHNPID